MGGDLARGKSVHSTCVKSAFNGDIFIMDEITSFCTLAGDFMTAYYMIDGMTGEMLHLVVWILSDY